jgi:hypothetical protein
MKGREQKILKNSSSGKDGEELEEYNGSCRTFV